MNNIELMKAIEKVIEEFHANDDRDNLPDMPITKSLGKYCDHTILRAYTKREII